MFTMRGKVRVATVAFCRYSPNKDKQRMAGVLAMYLRTIWDPGS